LSSDRFVLPVADRSHTFVEVR